MLTESSHVVSLKHELGSLHVKGLAKTYSGGLEPVFDGINFAINPGEFVCIIGHSGCGKTTILNILAGLESATAGVVQMAQTLPPRCHAKP